MNCKQLTKEEYTRWKNENYSGIGGSDAAAVAEKSKYNSPFKVWKDKLYGRESITNEMIEAGIFLEDAIAKHFIKENSNFEFARSEDLIFVHNEYPFIIANLDRLLYDPETNEYAVLEIKNTKEAHLQDWNGAVPDDYFWQVMHYLLVTQCEKAFIHVMIGGFIFKTIEFKASDYEDEIDFLLEKEIYFWETYILLRQMPPMDSMASTTRAVGAIVETEPAIKSKAIPSDIVSIIERMKEAETNLKYYENIVGTLKNEIKIKLRNFGKYTNDFWNISFRKQTSEKFNTEKFKQENPELYSKYICENSFQVMTINKKKVTNAIESK